MKTMMFPSIFNPTLLLPVLFFSLPFYFFSKFLERRIEPRRSGRQFLIWLMAILLSAFVYFFVLGGIYFRVIHNRLFGN